MIKVELYDDNFNLTEQDLKDTTLLKQLSLDCCMRISINDKNFFDNAICPLEFYHQLKEWHEAILNNIITDFFYITEDDDSNPVLSFIYDHNKKQWSIDAYFKNYCEENTFSTEKIVDIFVQFENFLLRHLNFSS